MNTELELMAMEAIITGGEGVAERHEKREQNKVSNSSILPIKCNFTTAKDYYKILKRMGIRIIDRYDDLFYNVELPVGWSKKSDGGYWSDLIDENGRKRASMFYKGAFYDRDAFIRFNRRFSIDGDIPDYNEKEFEPKPRYIQDGFKTIWVDEDGYEVDIDEMGKEAHKTGCWGEEYYQEENGDRLTICYMISDSNKYRQVKNKYRQVKKPTYIENPEYNELDTYKKYSQPFHYQVIDNKNTILFNSDVVQTNFEYSPDKHWEFFNHRDDLKKQAKQQCIDWLNNNYPCWDNVANYWDEKSCVILGNLKNKKSI